MKKLIALFLAIVFVSFFAMSLSSAESNYFSTKSGYSRKIVVPEVGRLPGQVEVDETMFDSKRGGKPIAHRANAEPLGRVVPRGEEVQPAL